MNRILVGVTWLLLAWPLGAADKPEPPILVLDAGGHTARVTKVLFTPDGKEVVSVSHDKTIRTWDAATGEPLRTLRPPIGTGEQGQLYAAALAPDGSTLAVAGWGFDDHTPIYLIDLKEERISRRLEGPNQVIHALAFSADGKHLASADYKGEVRVWDVAKGACLHTLKEHRKSVEGVAFAPDGKHLATASHDGTARVWSLDDGSCTAVLKGHEKDVRCVAWSLDGKLIATGSYDQSVRLWTPDGKCIRTFGDQGNYILAAAFAPDSRRLLLTRGGGGKTNDPSCSIVEVGDGKEVVRFKEHTNTVYDGRFSPDGRWVVSTGGNNHESLVWSATDGSVRCRLAGRGQGCWAAAWTADGHTLAWGHTARGVGVNAARPLERSFDLGELRLGPAPTEGLRRAQVERGRLALAATDERTVTVSSGGERQTAFTLPEEYEVVECFTLLDGDRAAVGSNFGLYLFDTRTGRLLRRFRGHVGTVWSVAPSPDNRLLLSASWDQTVRVWTLERDEPLLSLFAAGEEWVAWTPEGYYASSPGGDRLMGWHVNRGRDQLADFYPAEHFRKSLYRRDVIQLLLRTRSVEKALEAADEARGQRSQKITVAEVLPSKVSIVSPESGTHLREDRFAVKAVAFSVGDHPVTAMQLLVDGGKYVDPDRGRNGDRTYVQPREGEVPETWSVRLSPGPHELKVLIDSKVSQGESRTIRVIVPGEQELKPRLLLVGIGVGTYANPAVAARLGHAAHDAEVLIKTFKEKSKTLYRVEESKLLREKEATKDDILDALEWLSKEMRQQDVGVFFFSGHADRDRNTQTLYLFGYDVNPDKPLRTGVSASQVRDTLAGIKGKVVLILDACYAGAVENAVEKSSGDAPNDELARELGTTEKGLIVLCSSRGNEKSLEDREDGGYFTHAFVQALQGKAQTVDGKIYLTQAFAYADAKVRERSQGKQTPYLKTARDIYKLALTVP